MGGRLPISGIDIGGFGALGGLNFDMALASTFISTTAAFLECTKEEKCSKEKKYSLGGQVLFGDDGNFVNFADAIGAAPSSYLDNLSEINFDLDKNIKP